MAFPIILINATGGSDSAASGAGPATALTGSDASTSSDGLTVTLPNADLTNVATDGSHAVWLNTSSGRQFGRITAKANSGTGSANVTVSEAFGASLSGQSYAIGGVRASIGSASSRKLIDNASAAGDAMPGWTIRFQDGHAESVSASLSIRRSGDGTGGLITIEGEPGAAVLPRITMTANAHLFDMRASRLLLRDFEVRNTAGTKSNAGVFQQNSGSGSPTWIRRIKADHPTENFLRFAFTNTGWAISDCDIAYCTGRGIELNFGAATITGNRITFCGTSGIFDNVGNSFIFNNIIAYSGNHGVEISSAGRSGTVITQNTIHGNTGDGIWLNATGTTNVLISSNMITRNGAYGINVDSSAPAGVNRAINVRRNNLFGNTSGAVNPSGYGESTELEPIDGTTSAAADYAGVTGGTDFTPTNEAVFGNGFPAFANITPGAIQPAAGGGGTVELFRRPARTIGV